MTNRSDRGAAKPRGLQRFERDDVIRVSVAWQPPCQRDFRACEALPAALRSAMLPILSFASRSSTSSGS